MKIVGISQTLTPKSWLYLLVNNQRAARDFKVAAAAKCLLNCWHIAVKQALEFNVADVPWCNEQQRRLTGQHEALNEVTVLGHHHAVVAYRSRDDIGIGRTVP